MQKLLCDRCGGSTEDGYDILKHEGADSEIVCSYCIGDEKLGREEVDCRICGSRLSENELGPLCNECSDETPDDMYSGDDDGWDDSVEVDEDGCEREYEEGEE